MSWDHQILLFGVDPTVTLVANSFLLLVAGVLTVAAQ